MRIVSPSRRFGRLNLRSTSLSSTFRTRPSTRAWSLPLRGPFLRASIASRTTTAGPRSPSLPSTRAFTSSPSPYVLPRSFPLRSEADLLDRSVRLDRRSLRCSLLATSTTSSSPNPPTSSSTSSRPRRPSRVSSLGYTTCSRRPTTPGTPSALRSRLRSSSSCVSLLSSPAPLELKRTFPFSQSHVGGKVITLSASLPNIGPGALKNREDPKLLGTSKESTLLQAQTGFYKSFAIECSRSQVSVDMWLFSSAYTDVATLSASLSLELDGGGANIGSHRWSPSLHWWTDVLLPVLQRQSVRGCAQVCARVRDGRRGPNLPRGRHACSSFEG